MHSNYGYSMRVDIILSAGFLLFSMLCQLRKALAWLQHVDFYASENVSSFATMTLLGPGFN